MNKFIIIHINEKSKLSFVLQCIIIESIKFHADFTDCRSPPWGSKGEPAVNRQPGFRRGTRRAERLEHNHTKSNGKEHPQSKKIPKA